MKGNPPEIGSCPTQGIWSSDNLSVIPTWAWSTCCVYYEEQLFTAPQFSVKD